MADAAPRGRGGFGRDRGGRGGRRGPRRGGRRGDEKEEWGELSAYTLGSERGERSDLRWAYTKSWMGVWMLEDEARGGGRVSMRHELACETKQCSRSCARVTLKSVTCAHEYLRTKSSV